MGTMSTRIDQPSLWKSPEQATAESADYLSNQLITYIGNKRALLPLIGKALERVESRLGKNKLRVLDAFAGSGVVSRYLKQYASYLASNDLELYAFIIGKCYLSNVSETNFESLRESHSYLLSHVDEWISDKGIIRRLYAPRDDENIRPEDRVFYTCRNARLLDAYRQMIGTLPEWQRPFFLAPLLSEASIHANTAGVFKGFYKDAKTKIGQFGGTGKDALVRIKGDIELPFPVFSRFESDWDMFHEDANALVRRVGDFDVAYFDPPYNQHPYGSNYFMLNVLATYEEPIGLSKVSGIPNDWNRSLYNKRRHVLDSLRDLFNNTDSRFILLSYNNEGFVSRDEIEEVMSLHGRVETFEQPYNTFRGCRNLRNRNISVTEQLFLVERS